MSSYLEAQQIPDNLCFHVESWCLSTKLYLDICSTCRFLSDFIPTLKSVLIAQLSVFKYLISSLNCDSVFRNWWLTSWLSGISGLVSVIHFQHTQPFIFSCWWFVLTLLTLWILSFIICFDIFCMYVYVHNSGIHCIITAGIRIYHWFGEFRF